MHFLSAPDRSTRQGQRDYAVLLFLYNSGARASEAAGVLVEHLEPGSTGSGSVKLHGKGRKIRFCPLWTKTMNALVPLIHGQSGRHPPSGTRGLVELVWDWRKCDLAIGGSGLDTKSGCSHP